MTAKLFPTLAVIAFAPAIPFEVPAGDSPSVAQAQVYDGPAITVGCRDLERKVIAHSLEGIRKKTLKAGGNVVVLEQGTVATFARDAMWGPVPNGWVYDCRQSRTVDLPHQVSFSGAEYVPYSQHGTASITGQVFLKTRGGEVRYAAGDDVFLNPATVYQFALHLQSMKAKLLDKDGKPVLEPLPSEDWKSYRRDHRRCGGPIPT